MGTAPARIRKPVHPRACGELYLTLVGDASDNGSSPRMRGTPPRGVRVGDDRRFIPAHAGNSIPRNTPSAAPSVHPRACGELSGRYARHRLEVGSSPRMRGTLPSGVLDRDPHRFIPAHAGNSRIQRRQSPTESVHPRACGELAYQSTEGSSQDGSSPRMRGTLEGKTNTVEIDRFIPAHAGNSARHRVERLHMTVHPRACGELIPYRAA